MPARDLMEPVGYTYDSKNPMGPGTPVDHM